MKTKNLTQVSNITTGKLDANAEIPDGKFPFFTCAPTPLRINTFSFDDDVVLLAGNNAQGNFHLQRYKGKFDAYQRTYVITAKKGYDIDYIKYSLELSLQHLKRLAQGSQTKFLTMQILDSFQVLDAPYEEQKALISSVYAIDSKIRLNDRICSELGAMAKTLYDYWFVQFDFPDKNGKPYHTSGGEMVWNEQLKREIPKGWCVKSIINEFDVCYGYPFDTTKFTEDEDGIPIIRIRDILENTTSAKTLEIVDEKYKVNRGDLIVGMDGNFHMNFWSSDPALLNQRCFKISSLGYSVLIAYFSAKPYIKAREKNVTRTTVGHLSADDVQALSVLVPTEPEKRKFSATFDDILNKICQTRRENEELTKLRDWLLPMLMNGQARVE